VLPSSLIPTLVVLGWGFFRNYPRKPANCPGLHRTKAEGHLRRRPKPREEDELGSGGIRAEPRTCSFRRANMPLRDKSNTVSIVPCAILSVFDRFRSISTIPTLQHGCGDDAQDLGPISVDGQKVFQRVLHDITTLQTLNT
jgi:hypothetical protein